MASWDMAAMLFGMLNDQGVEFVEHVCISWQMFMKEALDLVIGNLVRKKAETCEQALGIGIDHEDRPSPCIEQHRIGCFRSYAMDSQQHGAECSGFQRCQLR